MASGKYNVTMADDVSRHDDIITFSVQLSTPRARSRGLPASSSCSAETGRIREDCQLTVQPLAA